jgi:hypothetical protein
MSASIWQDCDGERAVKRLSTGGWRSVEGQHRIATRKLVDSDAEQQLLEELIDRSKPPLAETPGLKRLHYLLATSFRYPPLQHGSRFGTRTERGIWYGSVELRTVFAEVAYYRLVFLEGTTALLEPLLVELTAFAVAIRARRGCDLTRPPFSRRTAEISSKTSYRLSQRLGQELRAAGVQVFYYASARDTAGGTNIGVFDPAAFVSTRPKKLETWLCVATRAGVEISRKDFFRREAHRFKRSDFEVKGQLPAPAL